jgi:hypothetical protein
MGRSGKGGHCDIHSLVHSAGVVLAAGFAGAGNLPDCLAGPATVPHPGDRGRRRIGIVARDFVLARARLARAAKRVEFCRATLNRVPERLLPESLGQPRTARDLRSSGQLPRDAVPAVGVPFPRAPEPARCFHEAYEYVHKPAHQEQAVDRESDAQYERDEDDFPMSRHVFLPKCSRSG